MELKKKIELRERILKTIDNDSRIPQEELAVRLGIEEEVLQKELKEMEEEGIICGYPTIINWEKTDCEVVTALIEVKVTPQRGEGFDKVAERIYRFDEVESVYLISGGFDLCVILEGKSMREVANFVSSKLAPLEYVLSTATNFVLKKYKENGIPLSDGKKEDERMMYNP